MAMIMMMIVIMMARCGAGNPSARRPWRAAW